MLWLGSLVVREGFSDISEHLRKSGWVEAKAVINNLETQDDPRAFRLRYAYEVHGTAYKGMSIGPSMKLTHSASKRLLSELRQFKEQGTAIQVRYNPSRPDESYFDVSPNDIFYAAFVLMFPVLLSMLFVMALFMELKQYLRKRHRPSCSN